MRFRRELHALGFASGFQWVDGSFLENIEVLDGRPPNDIDVVTFVDGPVDSAVDDRVQAVMDHEYVKREYLVDHYFVELNLPPEQLVSWSAYWYGVWSHRRSTQWKGFLQIDLDLRDDLTARQILEETDSEEAAQ